MYLYHENAAPSYYKVFMLSHHIPVQLGDANDVVVEAGEPWIAIGGLGGQNIPTPGLGHHVVNAIQKVDETFSPMAGSMLFSRQSSAVVGHPP